MMRLAICDDETLQLDILESTILECQIFKNEALVIDRFFNGFDLIKSVRSGVQYEFIFLDIHMPERNGLDIYAEIITSSTTKVIFVSTHIENLPEVFALKKPCFLYKPYNQDTFFRTVRTAMDNQSQEYLLACVKGNKKYILSSKKIRYIEAFNHKMSVNTDMEFTLEGRYSLDSLSKILMPYGFFRCHRSSIINLDYYVSHDTTTVYIMNADGTFKNIPLGRKSKPKINGAILRHKTGVWSL